MECYTYLRNVTGFIIWWEDALWKTFGQPFKGPIISFGSLVEYHPVNCEGSVKNPSIWKESLTWIVPRIRSVRGVNLEGWRTDRRPWGVGNDGRIGNLLEKTHCERSDISQTRRIYFSNRRWTNQNPWRRSGTENIHLGTASTNWKERVILTFLENQKGLFHNHTTHFRMPVKRWTISGPCRESFKYRHHVEPESNFTRREKNHSLFH